VSAPDDFDAVIVGGGHNGLVCAAYLARAGVRVGVFEARHTLGGATATEELWPGHHVDLGGSIHNVFHKLNLAPALGLEKYGLAYGTLDPFYIAVFPDGSRIEFHRDIMKTCNSIAAIDPADADAYGKFVRDWAPFTQFFLDLFSKPPTVSSVLSATAARMFAHKPGPLAVLRGLTGTYGDFLRRHFRDERVRGSLAWFAAQAGAGPNAPQSGPLLFWHPVYHETGMPYPIGGSGRLALALADFIRDRGGEVHTESPAANIQRNARGRFSVAFDGRDAVGTGRVVLATHLHTALNLIDDELLPARARKKLAATETGNGLGMVVRCRMSGLPNYTALPNDPTTGESLAHRSIVSICPSLPYLEAAEDDFKRGVVSKSPALSVSHLSAVDPTRRPDHEHNMYVYGQYHPYTLASGENWDDIAERTADTLLDTLAGYAPGVRDLAIDRYIQTSRELERRLGLVNGNFMHLDMTPNQMTMFRPTWSCSNYRLGCAGLYLTGASTHPGGGITGAPGKLAAEAVLADG